MSGKSIAFAIALFIFAPFFRKWIDSAVWPKILDWMSRRSQRLLEKRIKTLTRFKLLFYPDPSQLFIYAFRRLFLIIGVLGLVIIAHFYPAPLFGTPIEDFLTSHLVNLHPAWKWVLWFVFLQIFLTPCNMAVSTYRYLGLYLFSHEEEKKVFEAGLSKRIICLECQLKHRKAKTLPECERPEPPKEISQGN